MSEQGNTLSAQASSAIILYQRDGKPAIEARLDGDTVWLTQAQMADLYQTARTNIVEHIQHIYAEGELAEAATCRNFRQVRTEGTRQVALPSKVETAYLETVKQVQRKLKGKP